MRRWISWVRPDGLPSLTSRRIRSGEEPGSIEYSAVTQPLPLPRIQRGTSSSIDAVHSTRVRPKRDQHRAGGHVGEVPFEGDRAELVGQAAVGARGGGGAHGRCVYRYGASTAKVRPGSATRTGPS